MDKDKIPLRDSTDLIILSLLFLHFNFDLYDLEIIYPKIRWPDNSIKESSEKLKMMRQHHNISINALDNDLGFQAIFDRNSEADLWIHIIDDKKNIIGWSINKKIIIENQTANYFKITRSRRYI